MHRDFRVLPEEPLGVLTPLAELVVLIGVPGPTLTYDVVFDCNVQQTSLARDALAEHNVKFCETKWRCHLVLDNLGPDPIPGCFLAVLDGLDPPDIDASGRIELESTAAGSHLRTPEHHPDLLPELIDEDRRRLGSIDRSGEFAKSLRHETCLKTHMRVSHLSLDLGAGHQCGDRIDHHHIECPGSDQHVGDLESLLTGVGL